MFLEKIFKTKTVIPEDKKDKLEALKGKLGIEFKNCDKTAMLLLDISGSMEGQNLCQAKKGAMDFAADTIKNGFEVGLISFASEVKIISDPVKKIDSLQEQLMSLSASGSTKMHEAIKLATEILGAKEGSRYIVLATDGYPDDFEKTLLAAKSAKSKGIVIICVGVDDTDHNFLSKISSGKDLAEMAIDSIDYGKKIRLAGQKMLLLN
jgi:Mg-chelatase subunit ChlD